MRHLTDKPWQASIRLLSTWALAMLLFVDMFPAASGSEPRSNRRISSKTGDSIALNEILGESILTQNSAKIIRAARRLPPEKRYAYLFRWVLRDDGHDCRIDGTFRRSISDRVDVAQSATTSIANYPEAKWLLCPARELVELASNMGRLDTLRGEVLQTSTSSDDATTHYFNGREAYIDSRNEPSAPWVAVGSRQRAHSEIAELAIIGSPTIPSQLNLIANSALRGWASYYDSESNAGRGSWKSEADSNGQWTLTSERTTEPRGCSDENLLYYVRPLVWDATVSYEFEFREGSVAVHPCIGRSVFLLGADGVGLHQLTDGRYETLDIRSDNSEVLPPTKSENPNRSVVQEGWNQAELRITSDRVQLWLNDHPVAERRIESGESRTFGLFHYQDQSRAHVRNMSLQGDWPRELPTLETQPLASQKVVAWDAKAKDLDAAWSHDFRQGAPPNLFLYKGDENLLIRQSDGVRLYRPDKASTLTLNFAGRIEGDFDIVLEFKDLAIGDQKPTWHCGAGFAVMLDNSKHDRMDIVRRRDRINRHHHIVFAQNRVNRFGGVNWVKDTTRIDESVAGRLRIIRQGKTLDGLYADGDSDSFRYLDEAVIEEGHIAAEGLRLYTVGGQDMTCAVTFVRLDVRADAITLPPGSKPQTYPTGPPATVPASVPTPTPAPTPTNSLSGRLYDSLRSLFP